MSRVLVTGSTGFIGRALCRRLQLRHEVLALVRPTSANIGMYQGADNIQIVLGSMEDCAETLGKLGRIDALIHLAWDGMSKAGQHDQEVQADNYAHSMALVRAAGAAGCEVFIAGGSQAEYAPSEGAVAEDSECDPTSEYGKAKLRFTHDGARLGEQLGMKCRVARIFSVYGPHDHPWTLIPSLLLALARREEMLLTDCRQLWNYLYVEDAAAALEGLVDPKCRDGVYNIASTRTSPLSEFVLEACALFPDSPRPRMGALSHGPQGPRSLQPSVARLVHNTGWREMVSFAEGLRLTWGSLCQQQTERS